MRLVACALAVAATGCLIKPKEPHGASADASTSADGRTGGGDGSSAPPHYVFVTYGVLGPPWDSGRGAQFCGAQAQLAHLPGNFIPWLSFSTGVNAGAVLRSTNTIDWYLPNGTLFAATVDDLLAYPHALPLDLDQFGHDVTMTDPNPQVATGTTPDGYADAGTAADCPSGSIEIGNPAATDGTWTAANETTCSVAMLRLYCFSVGG